MTQWINEYGSLVTLVFTAAVAISTVVYAVLTWKLVSETRRMRQAQTDPKVAVSFELIEEFMNFGHLWVQNIGLGPAYDIQFTITPDGSRSGAEMLIKDFCKAKYFQTGVKYLGPSQKLRSGYTSFPEGYADKIKAVLVVGVCYKSADGRVHTDEYRVDFSELEGTERLGTPHLYSIAETLKKIQSDFHHVTSGFKRLNVDAFDADDRSHERAQIEEQIAAERRGLAERNSGGTY